MSSDKSIKHPIIVLTGCTASGKSSMALELAKQYKWPIINADSKQVYKELSIGTDKPIADKIISDRHWIVSEVDHYLYGYVSLTEGYNVSRYQADVSSLLHNTTTTALMVGGTGLYIDAVTMGFQLPATTNDPEDLSDRSIEDLHSMLGKKTLALNPSDKMNRRRLIRLIESSGMRGSKKEPLDHLYLVLDRTKEDLRRRSEQRIDEMFNNGLPEEAETLKELICSKDGVNVIGYKEFREYFEGKITLIQVKQNVLTHTRQYAKRQRTWFRRRKDAIFIKNISEARSQIENFFNDR